MTFSSVMRALWLLLAIYCATIAADYVDQQRGQVIGMCPPFATPNGAPGIMVMDNRTGIVFCSPLPTPEKSVLPPVPPSDNPKTGV
jgi:hypothetical protein